MTAKASVTARLFHPPIPKKTDSRSAFQYFAHPVIFLHSPHSVRQAHRTRDFRPDARPGMNPRYPALTIQAVFQYNKIHLPRCCPPLSVMFYETRNESKSFQCRECLRQESIFWQTIQSVLPAMYNPHPYRLMKQIPQYM